MLLGRPNPLLVNRRSNRKHQALQQSRAKAWIPCRAVALWVTKLLCWKCWCESLGTLGSPAFTAAHSD